MRFNPCIYSVFISFLLILSSPFTSFAEDKESNTKSSTATFSTKDEVIYGKLNANGHVENMYVVNSFAILEPGEIIDYGKYGNIKNLTDLTEIKQTDDIIQFQSESDHFFYQGELINQSLPWHISITYLLDGEEIHPDELAGQNGALDIQIKTKANKSIDPLFFEHYLLQISLTLDPLIFDDIQAPKGTEVNEGKNKQITFTVLPDKEDILIVSANANKFAMDPIQIAAIPANILIDDPDTDSMTDDLQSLSSAIRDINTGVKMLKDNMSKLNDGMIDINDGSTTYKNGINELNQSSTQLINGSKQIKDGLKQINRSLTGSDSITEQDLNELKQLPKGLREISTELNKFAQFLNSLDEAINAIPNKPITKEQFTALYSTLNKNNGSPDIMNAAKQLENTYYAAQNIKQIRNNIPGQLGSGLIEIAGQLDHIANHVDNSIGELKQLDNLSELFKGLKTLGRTYDTFHEGLIAYTDGVGALATSYKEIDTGLSEITRGLGAINNGIGELYKGTNELQQETDDLPTQMEAEIEAFLEDYDYSNFDPISFISNKNQNIGVVQFVLQTEKIEIEKEEFTEEQEEVEKGFWERFMNLFSLN